jgi:signal transduction histidine kinase
VRVFQRFERGPHSDGISGCGLGLAIVERVAAAHHGSVALDASPRWAVPAASEYP